MAEVGGCLVVGEGAAAVQREVGATAWAALEVLASQADRRGNHLVVAASVRGVADALGLAKNTAHRAVRRLVEAGLVAPDQARASDGRFVAGAYVLALPPDVLRPLIGELVAPRPASRSVASVRPRHSSVAPPADRGVQLQLLSSGD
jgi:hypothetical protein